MTSKIIAFGMSVLQIAVRLYDMCRLPEFGLD